MKKVLVTGSAGCIGFHLTKRLLKEGFSVVGYDSVNHYYNPQLKYDRLLDCGISDPTREGEEIHSEKFEHYSFIKGNLEDKNLINKTFQQHNFDYVVNLAAQAGVRYSLENPQAYIDSNITGFLNILEACRHNKTSHLVYASSSSVYGANKNYPFQTTDFVDNPVSLYAASKKSNELMAHCYSHLFNIPSTGLRFFTVYGPWGRPDMAMFLFTESILKGEKLNVFNNGDMIRDFTYVDDIVEGIFRVMNNVPDSNNSHSDSAPYRIYNIGNSNPVKLMDCIDALQESWGKKAELNLMPIQPGDVEKTYADVRRLKEDVGYNPDTPIKTGIQKFVEWYKEYFKIK
jgi:UDP-glucuronate 4-epimerase